ncbi:hypothetical protein [Methylobacterium sp. NEAU K]|uniref:hypothetical protein n=1 Tax=Methylobacterium sp. NEAU K TaxID=3064946 RepID=UPI0027331464|nr:hypothetical protein [Methylobacterium sp. NEAU K]MDP4002195.1 hypothetical protein [Methylobacterium sp. NEAU K]
MYRALLSMIPLVLASTAAQAEDFTGFYAGLNAGYARGEERDRVTGSPAPVPGAAFGRPAAGSDLPPSARDAATALRRSGRSGATAAAAR